jgi:hypothetical protein
MLHIIDHFIRIGGIHDNSTPLALYLDKTSNIPKLINSVNIESLMQHVGSQLYHICPKKDKKELQHWSAHSLRVGACVISHSMGFTEIQIKWLLRWRSDAFKVYLRNLAVLSNCQHTTFDDAAAMPYFL